MGADTPVSLTSKEQWNTRESRLTAWAEKRFSAILLGISVFVLGALSFGLDRLPIVWVDEATLNDAGRVLAERGQLSADIFGRFNGFNEFYHWQPPGQSLTAALSYEILGFNIWATRIVPVLFVVATVFLAGITARRLGASPIFALVVAGAISFDPSLASTARSGRMDAQAIFFLVFTVFVIASAPSPGRMRFVLPILGGVAGALAVLTHPAAIAFVIALGVSSFFIQLPIREFSGPFVLGGLIVAIPYLVWLLPYWSFVELQFLTHGGSKVASPLDVGSWVTDTNNFVRGYFYSPIAILSLFAPFIAVLSWKSQNSRIRSVALATGFAFLVDFFLLDGSAGFYELYYVIPGYMILGVLGTQLWAHSSSPGHVRQLRKIGLVVIAILLLAWSLAVSHVQKAIVLVSQWDARSYDQVQAAVDSIPLGCSITGSPTVWYAATQSGRPYTYIGMGPDDLNSVYNPEEFDYLILPENLSLEDFAGGVWDGRSERMGDFGVPLPKVFGLTLASGDYQLVVWKTDSRTACLQD